MADLPDGLTTVETTPSPTGGITVKLAVDAKRFVAAVERAGEAMQALSRAFWTAERRHRERHHRIEDPRLSKVHAAYDRRRRARRRRNRR